MASEKTTALVYMLLRDHLPAGVVQRLVADAQMADSIEYTSELGALAYRFADLLDDDDVPAPADTDDDEALPPLVAEEMGGFNTADGSDLSDAVVEWLDLFDDRLRGSEHFVTAVNEAAAAGRLADEDTARLVADRVRELAQGGKA